MKPRLFILFTLGGLLALSSLSPDASAGAEEIVLHDCLIAKPLGRGGRFALHRDPLEAQIVAGKWAAPKAGESVVPPDPAGGATQQWSALAAGADGWFTNPALAGGYAYMAVGSDRAKVMLLEARGDSLVYVNGVPRTGDPYETGTVRLPVLLTAGTNDLLFLVGRGRLQARLTAPAMPLLLDARDATLPDLVRGEKTQCWGALVLINASTEPVSGLAIEASAPHLRTTRTPVPPLLPLSVRKIAFRLEGPAPVEAKELSVALRVTGRAQATPPVSVRLRVREPNQTCRRTFLSDLDGSVQYYALNPAQRAPGDADTGRPALILSLHGAGVEALGQADAYAGKTWAHIVAPTNRRPYGFDWEDWGRLDAMEVLEIARKTLRTDPHRTYLTGHSMGGHGTWQLGVTFPDRFAAIGPSAGWISFTSYAGGGKRENPTPVEAMLERAAASSDTLALAHNLAGLGVYILHGSADDNVPPTEARFMNTFLTAFHKDFTYHEQPGAGHWWGSPCVDWPPMFDLFARHYLPDNRSVRQVEFTTVNPGVSASSHWLTIAEQLHPLQPSSASLSLDPGARRVEGTTVNVARLALDLSALRAGQPLQITLDAQKLAEVPWPSGAPCLWLQRRADQWEVTPPPAPTQKGPHRSGPFKQAFTHRMLFVYGTRGTPEENAWALAKARYDAETFWYRGNGSVDTLPDTAFDATKDRDRSVILYGNAETNGAWAALLADSPVQVRRGAVRAGTTTMTASDLACLFLRPRPGSETACVGVIAGSGLEGMRLAERLPTFLSGVGFPDCLVVGAEALRIGSAGVRMAGFFGNDWGLETGEFAWNRRN